MWIYVCCPLGSCRGQGWLTGGQMEAIYSRNQTSQKGVRNTYFQLLAFAILLQRKIFTFSVLKFYLKMQLYLLKYVFKGRVVWDCFFAHCILSRIERKDLKFFHVVLIFTGFGQDLTYLAHKENTHSEMFLLDRQIFVIAFCSIAALI